MIKPLFLGVEVFLFVQEGAEKGRTNYIVYLGDKQVLNNRLSIKNDTSFYPSGFIFSSIIIPINSRKVSF